MGSICAPPKNVCRTGRASDGGDPPPAYTESHQSPARQRWIFGNRSAFQCQGASPSPDVWLLGRLSVVSTFARQFRPDYRADAFRRRQWSKYVIFLKTDSVSRECKARTAPAIPRNSLRTIQTSLCAQKRNSGIKYGIVLALCFYELYAPAGFTRPIETFILPETKNDEE